MIPFWTSYPPFGRCPRDRIKPTAIGLAAARYFNQPSTLLRTPLLLAAGEAALNPEGAVPLVFPAVGDQTLRQYLHQAAAVVEESYAAQDYPLHALCADARGVALDDLTTCSLSSASLHGRAREASAPIHFACDSLNPVQLTIDFDPDTVEPLLAAGLATVVGATLAQFVTLSLTVREVERVSGEERAWLLAAGRGADGPATPFRSVPARFEAWAAATPDAPALLYEGSTLTYGELNRRGNQLARHLLATGSAEAGPVVGLWMARAPEMVVAVLGVLKAGLAYLPIDAECPPGRLAAMLHDAGARRLLVDASTAPAAAALDCECLRADQPWPAADPTNPGVPIQPADLAYLIYTSGSTGEPKGCAIEHQSLANYLQWATTYYWPTPDTGTMALFTPLSFDLTVSSLFCPLLRGRPLVVYPQQMPIDAVLRHQLAPGSPVDTIKLTPSHISLLDAVPPAGTPLRLAIVGGEALSPPHVARLTALDPRLRVINEYGPTEATVGCLAGAVTPGAPVTIGRPIANTRAYVLDADQQLVPPDVRGEICIGGAGLARGYHARPALTADRFCPDPFVSGARLYRTGDIGRWLPSGELECLGRLDDQVKIRGYRIELGEVEAALRRCAGIQAAAVLAQGDADTRALVAFLVSPAPLVPAALRRTLAATLPPTWSPPPLSASTPSPSPPTASSTAPASPGAPTPLPTGPPTSPPAIVSNAVWRTSGKRCSAKS